MKIICPFCKTEYDITPSGGLLECACCAHIWRPKKPNRFSLLWVMSLGCFILALVIFTSVVFIKNRTEKATEQKYLVVNVTNIRQIMDAFGEKHFAVSGTIYNKTPEIQGVPDTIVILRDDDGNELARQKFLPAVPLLDIGESVEFTHTFGASVPDAKKVSVELDKQGN